MIVIALTNGTQYIQNPDFSIHTSISDISNWYVVGRGGNIFTPSTANDWELIPYGNVIESPATPAYLVSLNDECILQSIASLAPGYYEFGAEFILSSNINPASLDSSAEMVILSLFAEWVQLL